MQVGRWKKSHTTTVAQVSPNYRSTRGPILKIVVSIGIAGKINVIIIHRF